MHLNKEMKYCFDVLNECFLGNGSINDQNVNKYQRIKVQLHFTQ